MNEREQKKLASAGKRTTDISLDNPSQHPLYINTSHGDYARLPRGVQVSIDDK